MNLYFCNLRGNQFVDTVTVDARANMTRGEMAGRGYVEVESAEEYELLKMLSKLGLNGDVMNGANKAIGIARKYASRFA